MPELQEADPLRRSMVLLGDRWTLLILQSVFLRVRRYDQLRDRLGISPTALSGRLRTLVQAGVLSKEPYRAANRTQHEYWLTEHGLPLWQLLVTIWTWEAHWVPGRAAELPLLTHTECGSATTPLLSCGQCTEVVDVRDIATSKAAHLRVSAALHNKRFTLGRTEPRHDPSLFFPTTMELLGDQWSAGILVCAMLGYRHFTEFQRELGIGPSVLSTRLRRLVDLGVLHTGSASTRADACAYLLTEKGRAFFPPLAVIVQWTRAQYPPGAVPAIELRHPACGSRFEPVLRCADCAEPLRRTSVRVKQQ